MSPATPQNQAKPDSRRERRRREQAEQQIAKLEMQLDAAHTRELEARSQLHTAELQLRAQQVHIARLEALVGELTDRLTLAEQSKSIIVTGRAASALAPRD